MLLVQDSLGFSREAVLCALVTDMQVDMKLQSPSDTSFYVPGNGESWEW